MKCPCLQETYRESCKATREAYIPSRFEMAEYCTGNGYTICPRYVKSASEGNINVAADAPGKK
jgi:hypothetical protein